MAKKKTPTKKTTSSAKKAASVRKTPLPANKKAPTAKKTSASASARRAPVARNEFDPEIHIDENAHNAHEQNIALLPPGLMDDTIEGIDNLTKDFVDVSNSSLTLLQRKRKIGPGTRNYGFVDKVSDIALVNPKYAYFFKLDDLKNCVRNVEVCRTGFPSESFRRTTTTISRYAPCSTQSTS
jgi:hypothetical protein